MISSTTRRGGGEKDWFVIQIMFHDDDWEICWSWIYSVVKLQLCSLEWCHFSDIFPPLEKGFELGRFPAVDHSGNNFDSLGRLSFTMLRLISQYNSTFLSSEWSNDECSLWVDSLMKLFLPLWFYLVMLVPGFSPLAFMKPYKKTNWYTITITIVIIIITTATKPERSSSPPSSHPRWRAFRSKPRFQSSRCLQEFTMKIKIGGERWQWDDDDDKCLTMFLGYLSGKSHRW